MVCPCYKSNLFFAHGSFKTMFVGFPKGQRPFGVIDAGKMVQYLIKTLVDFASYLFLSKT